MVLRRTRRTENAEGEIVTVVYIFFLRSVFHTACFTWLIFVTPFHLFMCIYIAPSRVAVWRSRELVRCRAQAVTLVASKRDKGSNEVE